MIENLLSMLDSLDALFSRELISFGDTSFTLGAVIKVSLWVCAVFLLEKLFRRMFVDRLLARTKMDPTLRFGVARIAGYLFIALGVYLGLQAAGVNLSSLAVLVGALGVGIGFGLQNIINNFVSGLIILAERPISIGDRIEVQGVAGRVVQIKLRSTVVITNDNISIIVPNSDFIENPVTNWSHGDPKVRLRVQVGVAYGSDVDKVRRILLEVGETIPKALKVPGPTVFFTGFGDSSLNFELGVWTDEMAHNPRAFQSDLYFSIEKALRDNGIEIPFPQRDLHVRSGKLIVEKASDS